MIFVQLNHITHLARLFYICFLLVLVGCWPAGGQVLNRLERVKLDSIKLTQSKFINNIFRQAVGSVQKTPESGPTYSYLNTNSEVPYLQYQDRFIRKIYIAPLGFDRNFNDTSQRDNSTFTRLGRRFHRTTRAFVIRDNLFFREGMQLNAFRIADNERYLRTLGYIQDARIIAVASGAAKDSVDLFVYTKDFFSIGGGASSQFNNHIKTQLYESNLAGMGQRLEVNTLYDYTRTPVWGYGMLYSKNNVMHSFADATLAYSTTNGNAFTGQEETATFASLSRPLVSPYSHFAGAVTWGDHRAYNVYHLPASVFFDYRYHLFDAWLGYNIGIKQLTHTNNTIRDRRFLSVRYLDRNFLHGPVQVGQAYNPVYNDVRMLLGQFTFFRQDYVKTQYIYGFGTTEDVPYGYNISFAGGWHRQLDLERPYAGVNLNNYLVGRQGSHVHFYLKAGGFLHQQNVQDGGLLIGVKGFSRVYFWGPSLIRQFFNFSFSEIFNRVTYPQLRVDNSYGLRGFLSDSAYGQRRISVQTETEYYLRYKLFGFQFAPFIYADLSALTPENKGYKYTSVYSSLGGGIRARNPNLVFETIEVRAYFFPVAPDDMRGFKVITTSNIRFRYNSNYVTAPDVVQLNAEN